MFLRKLPLALLLGITTATVCFAAVAKTQNYPESGFDDVTNADWFAADVKNAYEYGLMTGVSPTLFEVNGNLTAAQAVTVASRLHAARFEKTIPEKTGEWYAPYVDYAIENGLLEEGRFDDYEENAARRDVAALFARALPEEDYPAINDIDAIPDVSANDKDADELLLLYRAGVLLGNDGYGFFYPDNDITRAEAAAIICRAALPDTRLTGTLRTLSEDDAYELVIPTTYTGGKEMITSGWVLDNRGGVPRFNTSDAYGTLMDIRTDAGTAMIREFNKTTTGRLDVRTGAKLPAEKDGFYLAFGNEAGKSVYRLEIVDGTWSLLQKDGSYEPLCDAGEGEQAYTFRILLDLDNCSAITAINDVNYGDYPLAVDKDDANLMNFRFATTEKSLATAALDPLDISVNYSVFKSTLASKDGILPVWTGSEEATLAANEINLPEGENAAVRFFPLAGKVVCESSILLPEGESLRLNVFAGDKTVLTFETDDTAFYVNGETVYDGYYHNLWYRLRFEIDGETNSILVKVNGRIMANVKPLSAAFPIDSLSVTNLHGEKVTLTDFRVFSVREYDDYVPEPVIPRGTNRYVVGMNVCSLWKNGNHYGWSCISPYTDHELALGYYDEGNPETADWEIKYTLEHGIDYQAFCVFFSNRGGVQKLSADHLFNGFMNAKYADMAKYCIIWEATSGGAPASFEEWKTYYVPYFLENFFKDERYITVDGMPIVCVFSPDMLARRIGSEDKVKECFDYLRSEAARVCGFKGVLFLACGSSCESFAKMGFDGCYAYNWGTAGSSADMNKNNMVVSGDQGAVYNVPTVSVGFNSVAWHGKRYPVMTYDDYRTVHEWVRDRYLDAYPTQKWQENLVMLSTWNEYGEGTFIMPTADENGFGYLDVLREVYTGEKASASVNTVPTPQQKARINRLYPQYRKLLRKEGYYTETVDEENISVLQKIDYASVKGLNVWGTREYFKNSEGITGVSGADAILMLDNITGLDTADVDYIRITARTPVGHQMMVLFITDEDENWTEEKGTKFVSETDEMTTYVIPTRSLRKWSGKLKGIRIDPVEAANTVYTVKSAEFIAETDTVPMSMVINGLRFDTNFRPVKKNGDTLVALDPSVAMDYRLNCFAEWDKDGGILSLSFVKHTLIFTVGSDGYLLDGKEKQLGYPTELLDGLPLVPMNRICADVGYSFEVNDAREVVIGTDQKAYIEENYKETPYGSFEFNAPGNTEGFASSFMSLVVSDGYMRCTSITPSNDPTVLYEGKEPISLPTKDYTRFEMRVRYDFEYRENTPDMKFKIYFATDKQNSYSEWKSIPIPLEGTSSDGEWVTYSVDLSELPQWTDTVTGIRVDPFDSQGTFDIDYLRFLMAE